jgi:hypothetical protein
MNSPPKVQGGWSTATIVLVVLGVVALVVAIVYFTVFWVGVVVAPGGGGVSDLFPPLPPGLDKVSLDLRRLLNLDKNGASGLARLQMRDVSRLQVDDNNAMTVTMQPDDPDGANNDADKRRNEVRMTAPEYTIRKDEEMVLVFQLRVNSDGNANVSGSSFFHLFQLKRDTPGQSTRPLMTVGIKNRSLTVYQFNSRNNDTVAPMETVRGQWVSVHVLIRNSSSKGVEVKYTVGGVAGASTQSGSYTVPYTEDEIYLKFGQYRDRAVSVSTTTSVSFRNIQAAKSKLS